MTAPTENTEFETALTHALALHQSGEVREALQAYEHLLPTHPNHAQLLYLIGTAQLQLGQLEAGAQSTQAALVIAPQYLAAWQNLANALNQLQRFDQALESFEHVIALDPHDANAHFQRGDLLSRLGRLEEAVTSYTQAIAQQPRHADAWNNCGLALMDLERYDEALTHFDSAIRLRRDFAHAHYNKGLVLKRLQRFDQALASYDAAIEIKPDYVDAHLNRGNLLHALKRETEALASYDTAIALSPNNAQAYNSRGIVLQACQRMNEATVSYNLAISLNPNYAEAYNNCGNALFAEQRFDEALQSYDKAIALDADFVDAHNNRGVLLHDGGRWREALMSFDQVLAIQPSNASANWNKSCALLRQGDFDNGWKQYEWRWQKNKVFDYAHGFTQSPWLGETSLVGKTVLLHAEQGLGDSIQFCRYAKLVSDLGAKVLFEVPSPLIGLFENLSGVSVFIEKGATLPDFDYHCPLLSLPLAFKTNFSNIPSPTPYLSSQPAKVATWQQRLGLKTKPRVGLIWRGNPEHYNDRNRSIALAEVCPHLPPEFAYVSLQKVVSDADQHVLHNSGISHFGDALVDFTDTAALCELMDVVISVDTSVAHLSAAIGRPTWILLPYSPDWRWLLDRDDSPWYASVKLYRQDAARRWHTVLAQVAADLRARL